MTKFKSLLEDFERAVEKLAEVLKMEKNEVIRDSAIQRFEFTFELAWKTTKAFLEEYHNVRCISPRDCFREAFHHKMIEYSDFWVEIAKLRNETAHTYNEKIAEKIYEQLPKTLDYFKNLISAFKNLNE